MARPIAAKDGGKRTKQIMMRVSDGEARRLDELCLMSGLSRVQFLLNSTVYRTHPMTVVLPDEERFDELLRELNHQGVNLNQAAAALNSANRSGDPEYRREHYEYGLNSLRKLGKSLTELYREIESLVEESKVRRTL